MAVIYRDLDVNIEAINGKTVAILGYGNQGRAHAQNLRDSGIKVVVGLRKESKSWELVKKDGLKALQISEAVKCSDIITLLTPDSVMPEMYQKFVASHLSDGSAILFAHGFNIHYNQIVPPVTVDVIMVAPKGPGKMVRERYLEGKGVPALLAVYQDYTGQAKPVALAYAKALGSTRVGVLETTFSEETETDLFGEQCVLCGGVPELIRLAFETLIELGYQPEVAYFECLYELKAIVDLIYEHGIAGMREYISDTANYGSITRGKEVIGETVRKAMRKIIDEIRNGQFAKEWITEYRSGMSTLQTYLAEQKKHFIEQVRQNLCKMLT